MSQTVDVERVFHAWAQRQDRPHLCKLSTSRRKLISDAMRSGPYTADELTALIGFAYESDHERARFWRGENDRDTTYLDLSNLLVKSKLDERMIWALTWQEDRGGQANGAGGEGGSAPAPSERPRLVSTVAPGDEPRSTARGRRG